MATANRAVLKPLETTAMNDEEKEIALEIYDIIKDIKDPERVESLEELEVVKEDFVRVRRVSDGGLQITIMFTPTVPHCSLASLIGLCLRVKLERTLQTSYKLNIYVSEGTHSIEADVNKQINDKERVAAAIENPDLFKIVEECVSDRDL